jgi:hypothetical protein
MRVVASEMVTELLFFIKYEARKLKFNTSFNLK